MFFGNVTLFSCLHPAFSFSCERVTWRNLCGGVKFEGDGKREEEHWSLTGPKQSGYNMIFETVLRQSP